MAGIATPTSRCFHSPAGLSIPAVLLHLMFSLTDVVHCGKLLIIFFSTFLSLYLLSLQSFIFLTNSTSGMESLNGLLFLVLLEDTQFQESKRNETRSLKKILLTKDSKSLQEK